MSNGHGHHASVQSPQSPKAPQKLTAMKKGTVKTQTPKK